MPNELSDSDANAHCLVKVCGPSREVCVAWLFVSLAVADGFGDGDHGKTCTRPEHIRTSSVGLSLLPNGAEAENDAEMRNCLCRGKRTVRDAWPSASTLVVPIARADEKHHDARWRLL